MVAKRGIRLDREMDWHKHNANNSFILSAYKRIQKKTVKFVNLSNIKKKSKPNHQMAKMAAIAMLG